MDTIVIMVGKTSPFSKYKVLPKKALTEWPWIYYQTNKETLFSSGVHKKIWKNLLPYHYIFTNNYNTLFDMIVNHNHVAISSSIIKKSSYYKNHQLALIRLSQKMDMYCILAIKKDKLESKPIQEFIELLKKIFE